MQISMSHTPREALLAGIKAIAPISFAAFPFGLAIGVIAADVNLTAVQTITMSMFVFAGVAQLIALELLANDSLLWIIVLSSAMVNLRQVIYSASIAPHFKDLSKKWKTLISYLLIDQPYALAIAHYEENPNAPHKQWYYLGLCAPLWVSWFITVSIGYFAGAVIPDSWELNFVVHIMFLALLVPAIKGFPYLAAAIVAASVAIVGQELPHNLGLVTAILFGMATGALLEKKA